jgi:histidyl-tRNA synthetase
MEADTEILCGMYDTLRALGLERFRIRFSNRKVLNSLISFARISDGSAHQVFRVLDKLGKIGVEAVCEELTGGRVDASGDRIRGVGLTKDQVTRIREFLAIPEGTRRDVLAHLSSLLHPVESNREAVAELEAICAGLDSLGIPEEQVMVDPHIARGLDYYTGPVFEAVLTDAPEFGSVFGGGRYDGLVERFLGKKIPAVGASIGVDRLFAALQKLELVDLTPATARVLVTVMEPGRMDNYRKMTREIRMAGINTEMYLGPEKGLGKQLQYANRLRIPIAVIAGGNEFERNEVTIKNLHLGAALQDRKAEEEKDREAWLRLSRSVQATVPRKQLISEIRKMLQVDG